MRTDMLGFGTLAFNLVLLGYGVSYLIWQCRGITLGKVVAGLAGLGIVSVPLALFLAEWESLFFGLRLMSYAIFGHAVILLLVSAILAGRTRPTLAIGCVVVSLGIIAVGIDAFLVEPTALEITTRELHSPKIKEPIKVAVLADLQTDVIGPYEERVFRELQQLKPDLILLAGDHLQVHSSDAEYKRLSGELNDLLRRVKLVAPLGVHAIRGNTEHDDWRDIFKGTGIRTYENTESVDLGPLLLTNLSMKDSFDANCPDPGQGGSDRFHLIQGHCPNCALSSLKADLIVCGHTHGGQVQVPFIGPLVTMCQVPRSWAHGMNEISRGRWLIVSRGVGHERGIAPRLRFFCRPELAVINLLPAP